MNARLNQAMDDSEKKAAPAVWHPQSEKILKCWAELAFSYRLLHSEAHAETRKFNLHLTIPVIVLSTLTGTANFAQTTLPESLQAYAPAAIGGLNLVAGIITTIQEFLRVNERQEAHRVAAIHFGQLARSISVELSLPINDRTSSGKDFLLKCRQELEKVLETQPILPVHLLQRFNDRFSGVDFYKPQLLEIKPIEIFVDSDHAREEIEKEATIRARALAEGLTETALRRAADAARTAQEEDGGEGARFVARELDKLMRTMPSLSMPSLPEGDDLELDVEDSGEEGVADGAGEGSE